MRHSEGHFGHRAGWLRASVLGANDGIISTAALLLGVAAADASRNAILTAGFAGLMAGAISMALGEYVSVSSQRDSERSDIAKETWELAHQADHELEELTAIYQEKGLSAQLATEVAVQLTEHDALTTHLRDELGISRDELARPFQAAWSSAAAFTVGALLPLVAAVVLWPVGVDTADRVIDGRRTHRVGYVGARAGGAAPLRPIVRVIGGGVLAMAATSLVGWLFGSVIL